MLLWEAHKDLALSIGDAVNIVLSTPPVSTDIPDGVRYPKLLRDSYLYRAVLEIYRRILKQVTVYPRLQAVQILERLFPNMTLQVEVNPVTSITRDATITYEIDTDFLVNTNNPLALFIYSIDFEKDNGTGTYPIPFKESSINARGLINARNVQRADTFAEFTNQGRNIYIYDKLGEIDADNDKIFIRYLPYPFRFDSTIDSPNLRIDIEEVHVPVMLGLAQLYALTDSQEIQSNEQFLAMQLMEQPLMPQGQ